MTKIFLELTSDVHSNSDSYDTELLKDCPLRVWIAVPTLFAPTSKATTLNLALNYDKRYFGFVCWKYRLEENIDSRHGHYLSATHVCMSKSYELNMSLDHEVLHKIIVQNLRDTGWPMLVPTKKRFSSGVGFYQWIHQNIRQ